MKNLFIQTKDLTNKGYLDYINGNYLDIYDDKVFNARRRLIEAGYYDSIINQLNNILNQLNITNKLILDAGCGEGTILSLLTHNIKYGIDLSKSAIEFAYQAYPDLILGIADTNNLPFEENSFDCILNIFSLKNYEQFNKVLKPKGYIIKVFPLDTNNKYAMNAIEKQKEEFFNTFDFVQEETTYATIEIDEKDIQDYIDINPELFIYDNFEENQQMILDTLYLVGQKR